MYHISQSQSISRQNSGISKKVATQLIVKLAKPSIHIHDKLNKSNKGNKEVNNKTTREIRK